MKRFYRYKKVVFGVMISGSLLGIQLNAATNGTVVISKEDIKHADEYPHVINYINDKESIEPLNRGVGGFNEFASEYIVQPVAVSWATVVPEHGIQCIGRFFKNILYPKRLINSLLQGDLSSSGTESLRFLTNTTIGIVGLYDPAKNWWDIQPTHKDFGQTLAKWGVGEGCYVNLPLAGGTTARDGSGMVVDKFLDPTTYIGFYSPLISVGVGGVRGANDTAKNYYKIDVFNRSFADSYVISKMFFYAQRNLVVNEVAREENFAEFQKDVLKEDLEKLQQSTLPMPVKNEDLVDVNIVNYGSQGTFVDTLRYVQFTNHNDNNSIWSKISPWNSDFDTKYEERKVEIIASRPRLPYMLWEQDALSSPMAYIVPGMGTGLKSQQIVALSKLLYKKGYSVVVIPNTLNWEFVDSTLGNWLPGYLVEDGKMVTRVIKAVENDLKKHKNIHPSMNIMVGMSLGGTQALYLSALQQQNKSELNFDRYIAINPAIDLNYSMKQMDKLNKVWMTIQRDDQLAFLSLLAMKYGMLASKDTLPVPAKYGKNNANQQKVGSKELSKEEQAQMFMEQMYKGPMPFTPREAIALLSLSNKQTLVDLLYMIYQHNNALTSIPVVNKDDYKDFYSYAIKWNLQKYFTDVLVPFYQRKLGAEIDIKTMLSDSNLMDYSKDLAAVKNVFIFHTSDDFLVNRDQKLWIKKTFKGNNLFFSNGGHLGEMNTELFQLYFNKLVSIY